MKWTWMPAGNLEFSPERRPICDWLRLFTLKETTLQLRLFFLWGGGGEGGISLRTTLAILLCDKTLAFRSEHPNWDENMQIRFPREYLHMVVPQVFS